MKLRSLLFALIALPLFANAASDSEFTLVIKNHRFTPSEIKVPAGKKVKLIVQNQDATPEEFESPTLKREKIIAGNASASIPIGPLKAGAYPFFGEFNDKTARGVVIAE